jgi:hypothetical protein
MKRKTFDKILTVVGAGLTVFLFIVTGLVNWGASFASDSVSSQLKAQAVTMPAAERLDPKIPADKLAYAKTRAGKIMSTGKDAEIFADYYIAYHLSFNDNYATVSDKAMKATGEEKVALQAAADTAFKGEALRGTLLTAYAFGTLGELARYGAIAALIGALLMLVLTIAGFVHLRRTPDSATI